MTQSVKDAKADAETLLKMVRSEHRGFAFKNTDAYLAGMCALSEVEGLMRSDTKYIGGFWIRLAHQHALRAVPELRG